VILKVVAEAGNEYTLGKIDQREQRKSGKNFKRLLEQSLELVSVLKEASMKL
jgi:hypothetical protein